MWHGPKYQKLLASLYKVGPEAARLGLSSDSATYKLSNLKHSASEPQFSHLEEGLFMPISQHHGENDEDHIGKRPGWLWSCLVNTIMVILPTNSWSDFR